MALPEIQSSEICRIQFLKAFSADFLNFDFKTYCNLKMFILSAQNTMSSSYVEGHVKKQIQVWISCLRLVSRPPKSRCSFGKFTVEQVLKLFSGRNNSLNSTVFGFCEILPFVLEESREERLWLDGFWGNRHSKMQKISAKKFSCVFQLPLSVY